MKHLLVIVYVIITGDMSSHNDVKTITQELPSKTTCETIQASILKDLKTARDKMSPRSYMIITSASCLPITTDTNQ